MKGTTMELIPHAALGFHTMPSPEEKTASLREALGISNRERRAAQRAERSSHPKGRTERTSRPKGRTEGSARPRTQRPGSADSVDPSAD